MCAISNRWALKPTTPSIIAAEKPHRRVYVAPLPAAPAIHICELNALISAVANIAKLCQLSARHASRCGLVLRCEFEIFTRVFELLCENIEKLKNAYKTKAPPDPHLIFFSFAALRLRNSNGLQTFSTFGHLLFT